MGILTGKDEGIRLLPSSELAFIGNLTNYSKGMSTKSTPPTDFYTLEFEEYEQIRGKPMEKDEPQFHYMQTGSGGQIVDPKTKKLIPAPEPKRPKVGQLYLALLDEPRHITQLIEITTDEIHSLKEAGPKK